jgi:hypothetical protein
MAKNIKLIINELNELKLKSQIPPFAIKELSFLMNSNMKITYALKFNSGLSILIILLLWLILAKPVLGILAFLNIFGTIGYVFKVVIVCLLIFVPSIWTKSIVFTNTAIFVFSAYNFTDRLIIPINDINSIQVVRNAVVIDVDKKRYKYSRFLGITQKSKELIENAVKPN